MFLGLGEYFGHFFLVQGVSWSLFQDQGGIFHHFLGFGGILVIFRFQEYFGHFLVFGGISGIVQVQGGGYLSLFFSLRGDFGYFLGLRGIILEWSDVKQVEDRVHRSCCLHCCSYSVFAIVVVEDLLAFEFYIGVGPIGILQAIYFYVVPYGTTITPQLVSKPNNLGLRPLIHLNPKKTKFR